MGFFGAGKADECAVALVIYRKGIDVDAMVVEQTTSACGNANDLVPSPMHEAGGIRAHIAKTLNDHSGLLWTHAVSLQGLATDDHQSTSRGFSASMGAAQFERFPGDHGRDRMADMHGVGIHDPGHDLLVRVDVRTEDIFFWTQHLHQVRRVASGEPLEFTLGHLVWIANHPAGCAAEGDIYHRAFPGHPTGECPRLVKSYVGAVTQATLGRPTIDGVLHPESGKCLQRSIVHLYRYVHDDLAGGIAQDLPQAVVELELLRRQVGSGNLCFPKIDFFQICGCHSCSRDGLAPSSNLHLETHP